MSVTAALQRAFVGPARLQEGGQQHPYRRPVRAAAAKQKRRPPQRQGGQGFGKAAEQPELKPQADAASQSTEGAELGQAASPDASPGDGSLASSAGGSGELPAVSRDRIFAACAQVSLLVTAIAVGLRQVAPVVSPAARDGHASAVEALLDWTVLPSASQLAAAVGVAAAVTAARLVLLAAWPSFKESSERSNQQVLAPLGAADVLWVAALPALSEELLFRGALIPAIYPDWRGAAIAGLAFGVLHNNGGRNVAFAAWATAVGCSYGALFLATGSVGCPVLAHTLANAASAALWKAGAGQSTSGGAGAE